MREVRKDRLRQKHQHSWLVVATTSSLEAATLINRHRRGWLERGRQNERGQERQIEAKNINTAPWKLLPLLTDIGEAGWREDDKMREVRKDRLGQKHQHSLVWFNLNRCMSIFTRCCDAFSSHCQKHQGKPSLFTCITQHTRPMALCPIQSFQPEMVNRCPNLLES